MAYLILSPNIGNAIAVSNSHSERFLYRPMTAIQTMMQGNGVDAQFVRPLYQALGAILIRHQFVPTSVAVLLQRDCPLAVMRSVVARIIHALHAMQFRGAFAHICNKIFNLMPSSIHDDTPTAVHFVRLVRRIVASADHTIPNTKQRVAGMSVSRQSGTYTLITQTSTALHLTACQVHRPDGYQIAAYAFAQPVQFFIASLKQSQSSQSVKSLSLKIAKIMMNWFRKKLDGILIVGHRFSLLESVIRSMRSSILSTFYIIPRQGEYA